MARLRYLVDDGRDGRCASHGDAGRGRVERRSDRRPEAGARGHGDAPQRPPADQGPGHAGRHDRPALLDLDHPVRRADPARAPRARALMGAYNRTFLGARGPIPRDGCAPRGRDRESGPAASRAPSRPPSRSSRARSRARGIVVDHPESEDNDPVFHPAEGIDGAIALKAAERQKPGVHAEARAHAADFAVLQQVLAAIPRPRPAATSPSAVGAEGENKDDSPPTWKAPCRSPRPAARPSCWSRSRAKPMDQVGHGARLKADIQAMLRFHPVKFHYEDRRALHRRALRRADPRQAAPAAPALNGRGPTPTVRPC